MRSTSAWSRSTASAAASACVWPRTPTSRASRRRSWPASAAVVVAALARRATATAEDATAVVTVGRAGPVPTANAAPAARVMAVATVPEAEHRITTLDSGVRVVTERVPSVRSVALGFWIGTGSAAESESQAGISHLLEHMLFRGTERFGSEETHQILHAMGAEINAGTDKEATSLYTRVLDRHLERAFDVMSDMLWRPSLEELEAEREV